MHTKTHKYDLNSNKFEISEMSSDVKSLSKSHVGSCCFDFCHRNLFRNIIQIFYEYCSNTSIHGVQYLGETRPRREKIFWLCVFAVSIFCCSILINSIYIKWHETPVIVSFSEKSTPVWSIPFPAITICSETKRTLRETGKLAYVIYLFGF